MLKISINPCFQLSLAHPMLLCVARVYHSGALAFVYGLILRIYCERLNLAIALVRSCRSLTLGISLLLSFRKL